MKKNIKLILKNVFAVGVIIIFSIILGYGIITLQKSNLTREYSRSLDFNTEQYTISLQEKIKDYSSHVKEINQGAEVLNPATFKKFIYIGRLDKSLADDVENPGHKKEINTLSIRRDSDQEWYQKYQIKKEQAEQFFVNKYGFVNIHNITIDANDYVNENLFYFTYKESSIAKYAYIIFCQSDVFFNEQDKYGFEDCYIYDGNEILFGKKNYESQILGSNILRNEKTDIIKNSGAFSSKVIIEDEQNKLFLVTHTKRASLDRFLSVVTKEMILCMVLYLIIVFLAVGFILYTFSAENDYLKAFKSRSKDTYNLVTDEFGNILKADKKFKEEYAISNIFNQENIDEGFIQLDSKDSLYLKLKTKKGESKLLNFLCCKKNNKYKLVGIETANLERYFMREFGIKDSASELKRFKFNVERELKLISKEKCLSVIDFANFDEMKNLVSEAKIPELKAKIIDRLITQLRKYGNTMQMEDKDEIVLFIKNEDMVEPYEKEIIEGINGVEKQISLKEISFLPKLLVVTTKLDSSHANKTYEEIFTETCKDFTDNDEEKESVKVENTEDKKEDAGEQPKEENKTSEKEENNIKEEKQTEDKKTDKKETKEVNSEKKTDKEKVVKETKPKIQKKVAKDKVGKKEIEEKPKTTKTKESKKEVAEKPKTKEKTQTKPTDKKPVKKETNKAKLAEKKTTKTVAKDKKSKTTKN